MFECSENRAQEVSQQSVKVKKKQDTERTRFDDVVERNKESTKNIIQQLVKNGDGSLDAYELYTFLISKGILAPIYVVTDLFNRIDSSSDGLMCHEELSSYMIKPVGTKSQEAFKGLFCKIDVSWLCYLITGIGGGLFAIAGFATELSLTGHEATNLYLAGLLMYMLTGSRDILLFSINAYREEKSFERTGRNMQDSLKVIARDFVVESFPEQHTRQNVDNVDDSRDHMYIFIKEVIFAGREKLTRSDIELALLKEVGPVSDLLVGAMFSAMDADNNGTIDLDEMHHFITNALNVKVTRNHRLCKVLRASFTNVSWLMSLTYFIAVIIGISHNVVKRFEFGKDGLWVHDTFTPFYVTTYLYVIGTLVFSAKAFDRQGAAFDVNEKVRSLLEMFLKRNADNSQTSTNSDWENIKNFQDNRGLDKIHFDKLLQASGVFVPRVQLNSLFQEIDSDGGDSICKREVEAFVKVKKNRNVSIWKNCLQSFDFLGQLTWLTGSVSFLVAVYIPNGVGHTLGMQVSLMFLIYVLVSVGLVKIILQIKIENAAVLRMVL